MLFVSSIPHLHPHPSHTRIKFMNGPQHVNTRAHHVIIPPVPSMVQHDPTGDLVVQAPLQLERLALPAIISAPAASVFAASAAAPSRSVLGHVGTVFLVPRVVTLGHHGRAVVFEDVEHSAEVGLAELDGGEDGSGIGEFFEDWSHVLAIPIRMQLNTPLPIMLPHQLARPNLLPIQHLLGIFQHLELGRIANQLLQPRAHPLRNGQLLHLIDQRSDDGGYFGMVTLEFL
mmetsp:Transcript_32297/g.56226  ORF Transcript_32297/g.56226 Transcript_32297/m.56226 type:complete len:230 (-) Transcript_32297:788-1477(-)